jgi:hypothetical protein
MEKQNKMDEHKPIHNQGLCANVNYNLFKTKRYVSTKTLHVHLQKVCSHWELKQYESAHSQYHFTFFKFEFSLSNLLHQIILTT